MSRKRLEEEDSESSNDEEQASGTSIPLSREDITARRRIRRRLKRKQRQQREQPRLSKQCPVCERLMPTDSEHMLHHLMACVIQAMSTLPSHRSFPQFMPPAMQSTVPIAPASLPTVSHQIPNPVPAPAQSTPISTPNSQSTSSSITPPGTPTVVLMSNTTPVQSIPIPAAAVLPQTPAQVQIQQKPKESFLQSLLKLDDPMFKKVFGVDHTTFHYILLQLEPILTNNCISNPKQEKIIDGRPTILSIHEQIALWSCWMRNYFSETFLGLMAGVSQTTVRAHTVAVLIAFLEIFDKVNPVIYIPSRKVRDQNSEWLFGWRMSTVVDGTQQQVLVPGDKFSELGTYSGKEKCCCRSMQITVSPKHGTIYAVSVSELGTRNDINKYDKLENQIHQHLDPDEAVCGDYIYQYIWEKYHHPILTPYARSEERIPFKKLWNNELSSKRIIVERVIGQIKKYRICSDLYRGDLSIHSHIWKAAAILVQLKMNKIPLR